MRRPGRPPLTRWPGRELTAARDHYQASLGIRVKLAATGPSDTQWQRDLPVIRQRITNLGNGAPET